jgi:hypothetical protein
MKYLKWMIVAGMVLVATTPALAFTFNKPYQGPVFFKIANFDMGTTYPILPVGSTWGGTGANAADVPTLDGIAGKTQATGTRALGAFGDTLDDTWGIARVSEIDDNLGLPLWTPALTGTELTILFYGEQDIYLEQTDATDQVIAGVGLHFDMYEEAIPSATSFDPSAGSAGRDGPGTGYTTVTEGTLVLAGSSVAGHIRTPGDKGGTNTEFEVDVNASALLFGGVTGTIGSGVSFFEITGGTQSGMFLPGAFTPLAPNIGLPGVKNAGVRLDFTTIIPPNVSDWLVRSNDPAQLEAIPEPVTMLGLVMGLGGLGAYLRRRRTA